MRLSNKAQCRLTGHETFRQRRKVVEVVEQRFRFKPCHITPFRPERDQRDRHASRPPRLSVGLRIPHQHRPARVTPDPDQSLVQRRRIGLAHRQRIRADQRPEQVPHPELVHQLFRKRFRLVGADRRREACRLQSLNGLDRAGVKPGVDRNSLPIGTKKDRILPIHFRLALASQPHHPQPQHRPSAMERRQCIARVEQISMTHAAKTGIGRGNQVCTRIRERPVKVKNHSSHQQTPETLRKDR